MNVLVLGTCLDQLEQWRNRNFTQGDVHRRTTGEIVRGGDTYRLFVSTRNDDRVRGLEFQKLIILEGAVDYGGQYSMRIRP